MRHNFYYSKAIIVKPVFTTLLLMLVFFRRVLVRGLKRGVFAIDDYDLKFVLIVGGVVIFFTLINMFVKYTLYKSSCLEINEKSIIYKKKTIFSEKYKEASLDSISNIHVKRSLLDRLFSSVNLSLDIDSSETASKEDYNILMSEKSSEEFKALFDRYKMGSVHDDECFREELVCEKYDVVYRYSKKECLMHIALNTRVLLVVFLISSAILTISDIVEGFSIVSLLLFLFLFLIDSVKKAEKYYDYVVLSNDTHIRWEYGFINRDVFEVEKTKIRSVELKQTLVARVFKKYSVDINIVGVGNEKSDMKTIVLYSSEDKMKNIIEVILPNHPLVSNYIGESLIVLCYRLLQSLVFLMALLFLPVVRANLLYYTFFVIFVLLVVFLYSKNFGFDYRDGKILVREGLFGLRTNEVALSSIEHLDLRSDYVYAKFGIARLRVYYKDTKGFGDLKSPYLREESIQKVVEDYNNQLA